MNIFLIDGLGAMLSTIGLIVILGNQTAFGISINTLYPFLCLGIMYSCNSMRCYFFKPLKLQMNLQIVAILNLVYLGAVIILIFKKLSTLTKYGIAYFIIEAIIILSISAYEFKIIKRLQANAVRSHPLPA